MTRPAFAELCRQVCASQGWELLPTGVLVHLDEGRHQLVRLELFESERVEGMGHTPLVRLSTTVGAVEKLSRERLLLALEANATLEHGALAVETGQLCMTDTLLVETADAEELEAAIDYLARQADEFEHAIFGTDQN